MKYSNSGNPLTVCSIEMKAVQNKKRLSKKSTFCDDMLFTHRFQGNITS